MYDAKCTHLKSESSERNADYVALNVSQCLCLEICSLTYYLKCKNVSSFQHNVSQQEVIRGCREQKMKDLIYDIASEANHELETVQVLFIYPYRYLFSVNCINCQSISFVINDE